MGITSEFLQAELLAFTRIMPLLIGGPAPLCVSAMRVRPASTPVTSFQEIAMKFLRKLTILGVALAASAPLASATPIQLGSYATSGSNLGNANSSMSVTGVDLTSGFPNGLGTLTAPSSSSTYALNPNGVWASALGNSTWVGIASSSGPGSGSGFVNPAYGYYEFQTTFDVTVSTYRAHSTCSPTIPSRCSSTAISSFPSAFSARTPPASQNPTGCLTATETSLLFTDLSLNAANTLDFIVEQAGTVSGSSGSDPSGVDFNASLAATPEPGSFFLLGTGLLGATGIARRKFLSRFTA